MGLTLTDRQVRWLRLHAQRLLPQPPAMPASPEKVLLEVCGVQAQELPAALLAIHAREGALAFSVIERLRQEPRSIVRTWCMRGTLHLVAAQDARWLIPFFGPRIITADRRRMAELGWVEPLASRGLALLRKAIEQQGGLTREEIVRLLKANSLPAEGQAPIHLIARAASEGILCQGPDRGKKVAYLPFDDWVGPLQPLLPHIALAELARRYLAAYGPAAPEDLAAWSGLKITEARQAWKLVEDQLISVEATGRTLWLLKSQLPWLDAHQDSSPWIRLLPKFDNSLLGYASRDLLVDPAFAARIHPGGGIIRPTLLVDDRILGTWRTKQHRDALEVVIEPFESLPKEAFLPLDAEAASLGRFLGLKPSLVFSSTH